VKLSYQDIDQIPFLFLSTTIFDHYTFNKSKICTQIQFKENTYDKQVTNFEIPVINSLK